MKFIVCLALFGLAAAIPSPRDQPSFDQYKRAFGKTYSTPEEEARRSGIYYGNVERIINHNIRYLRGLETYDQEVNKFTDMTLEEINAYGRGLHYNADDDFRVRIDESTFVAPNGFHVPKSVDWRKKGYVTPIKNQGQCGSCWAFSTVGALEGQHFRKSKKLVSLSEQNLVDCDKYADGCQGAQTLDQAYKYIKENKGIDTEKSYPYTGVDGNCKFNANDVGATDTGFVDIPKGNETALTAACAMVGPISVAIDASGAGFASYKSGVYTADDCSSTALDHGVLVVGYGTMKGVPYYIVKNSWGADWGNKGYILMARNKNNHCGIATLASYPTV